MDPKTFLESDENLRNFVEGPLYEEHSEILRKQLQKKPSKTDRRDRMHGESSNGEKSQENFNKWLGQKMKQERLAREKEVQQEQIKLKEKEINAEHAKREFNNWLEKKQLEAKEKEKQKAIEQRALTTKEEQKQARVIQSDTSFKQWLRKKKEEEASRKLTDNIFALKTKEKKTHKDANKLAYDRWLKNLKIKSLPIPSRKSFDNLATSSTTAYAKQSRENPI